MGGFDEYIKEKRLKEKPVEEKFDLEIEEEMNTAFIQGESVYDRQKDAGLGENAEELEDTGSYAMEKIKEREAQSTFAERTEYYFKDSKYLEAKVKRYSRLGRADNPVLDEYSQKHRNRKADKRRKKARAAARSFEKARELEENLKKAEEGDAPLTLLERYKKRNEIMRFRMDGMINAAKVKATSDLNEGYRIAKAKLSCLSILYDQARQFKAEKQGSREDFERIEAGLLKEIADAQKSLRKYNEASLEKWKDCLGLNNKAYLDRVIRESGNPGATREDAKISLMLSTLADVSNREEVKEASSHTKEVFGKDTTVRNDEVISMLRFVKRDRNGKPINREERKKDEWNKKWLKAYSTKDMAFERKKLWMEALDRAKDFKLPSPEEIRKKGIYYYIKKDPVAYYEMHNMSLRMDNYGKADPDVYLYYQNNPVIRAKLDAVKYYMLLVRNELSEHHNINPQTMLLKEGVQDPTDERDFKENQEMYLGFYETTYNRIGESEKTVRMQEDSLRFKERFSTVEDVKAELKIVRKPFNEQAYKMFKDLHAEARFIECPHYRASYARLFSENKFNNEQDITRVCGSVLRIVHFDNNWKPLTEADMEAHLWNMKFLNSLVTYECGIVADPIMSPDKIKSEEEKQKAECKRIITEMVEEETDKFFKGQFALPSPEQLKREILEPLRRGEPLNSEAIEDIIKNKEALYSYFLKALTLEGTYKTLPFLKEFFDANPVYGACQDAYSRLLTILTAYGQAKYNISLNTGADVDMLTKATVGIDNVDVAQLYIEMYEENYNKFQNVMNDLKKG